MYSKVHLVQASDQEKGNPKQFKTGSCVSKLLLRISRNRDSPTTSASLFSHLYSNYKQMLFSPSLGLNQHTLVLIHFHCLVLCGPDSHCQLSPSSFFCLSAHIFLAYFSCLQMQCYQDFPLHNSRLLDVQTLATDIFFLTAK